MESSTPSRDTAWAMSEENVGDRAQGYARFNRPNEIPLTTGAPPSWMSGIRDGVYVNSAERPYPRQSTGASRR